MNLLQVLIFGSNTGFNMRTLRLIRLPRLYRLVRITRLFKVSKSIKKSTISKRIDEFFELNTGFSRLISFLFGVITCVHIVGCFWFYLARLDDVNSNTLVARLELENESNASLYLTSIYWAFQTLLTVGYGDFGAYSTGKQ